MAKQVNLIVNGDAVEMNPFVRTFVEQVVNGAVGALRGTGQIDNLDLSMTNGQQVNLTLNNAQVPLSPFAGKIIYSTIVGMVSSLKDTCGIESLKILIKC
ncbi:MAG: hypothetical protein PHR43_01740 [Dehalococcoidales bacterium]|nr:hypothetical protein [Dehalococcoidales bacterium]